MDVATKPTVEIRELECDGQLLRFKQPMLVEVDADAGSCGLWIPAFALGAADRDEAEAWDMLADLIITVYLEYLNQPDLRLHPNAIKQREAIIAAVSGFYLRQSR